MAGPNTKVPKAIHDRRGTTLPYRHNGVDPAIKKPKMPGGFGPEGKAHWKFITDFLFTHNLLSEIDGLALKILCDSIEIYAKAMDDIAINGIIIMEEGAKGGIKTIVNPATKIRDATWNQITRMCREFGLTPSARNGLRPSSEPNTDNAIGQLLKLNLN